MQSADIDPVKFVAAGLVAGRLSDTQIKQALRLRAQVFRNGGDDWDGHDPAAWHFGVWAADRPGDILCTFRVFYHDTPGGVINGYSGARYDLTNLSHHMGMGVELGRFCICPQAHNPNILRMAWAVLTRLVDILGADMLFGLSSFPGINPRFTPGGPALAALVARNPAPSHMAPLPTAGQVNVPLAAPTPNNQLRPGDLPPLVRTYLSMNAWFSGHYVVDHDLNTHNLFTCVEIAKVPETRARLLRRAAGLVAAV